MKYKALISTSNMKDHNLTSYAQKIVDEMTSNINYSSPQPPLASIQALILLYANALIKSMDGSKEDTANKNAIRTELENALSLLANYVNLTANHDLVKLESSGFNVSKEHAPIGILEAPILLIYFGKNPGEVDYDISTIPNATEYIILFSTLPAPADKKNWLSRTVSGTKGTLTGLDYETKYVFMATATSVEANKMNLYNYSNPVEQLVP